MLPDRSYDRNCFLNYQGKDGWSGFLETDDTWQEDYVSGRKGAIMRCFARKNGF